MPEQDPLFLSYSHLANFPREKEALHSLKKVASLVKPIMRARGWVVRELAEFYPEQQNLLGLNINHGQKILLRLRYPGDRYQFLPIEQVTDTLLHELSHIVHGPHDAKFHALWNQLRDEHEGLVRKGYTGEGFLSEGHRLGGGRIPMHEARRLARAAAEKRRALSAGSGQRLGGSGPRPGEDIRRVIASAVERRNRTLQGCGNTNHDEKEIQEISDTATRNGFRTQAEEDAANDAAIAQALWELVQEDEKAKYGTSYILPTAQNPEGNGGGAFTQGQSRPSNSSVPNLIDLEAETDQNSASNTSSNSNPASPGRTDDWTCSVCTLHNRAAYLCCDACGTERPQDDKSAKAADRLNKKLRTATINGTKGAGKHKILSGGSWSGVSSGQTSTGPAFWQCSFCGNVMERQWWTCSTCGKMKDSSK